MAGRRMIYRRPIRHDDELRPQVRDLERRADALLSFTNQTMPEQERCYYRSVGSVLQRDGRWYACDGDGNVVGEHAERWMAWSQADQYGTERAGQLG